MSKKQILVVEDELKIARIIKDYLENSGYQVTIISHGNEVLPQIQKSMPDLIILDIMLPGKDGMEICREIRKTSTVPIIMITAKVEEIDRLIGLELGADDYICKPFSPREVVARVKAVLRRAMPEPVQEQLIAGPIALNQLTHYVSINNQALFLTNSEFELLTVFMQQPERVFSRNDLISMVQGYDFEGYDRTIDSHIKNLRKKLDQQLSGQKMIQTVYGVGYKFSPPEK
ncbi:MAG: response regulator [Desulfobacteraceae bacterium]|jgi:two-component system response regulator BaeR|nr:response regulator [Desulfobacteraceae bacterium]